MSDFLHERGPHHVAGTPAPAPTPPPAPSAIDNLLDLSTPAPAPLTATSTAPTPPSVTATTARPAGLPFTQPGNSVPTVLTPKDPVVALGRIQSAVGVLTVEAACGPAVGDLRLGCAYELRSGVSSVVQYVSGVRLAPPHSKRPAIIAERGPFEKLIIDLAQVRDLDRLVIYAFSETGSVLQWGGTLVATTLGGARIELPLARTPSAQPNVLMSIYNVRGQLVIRAEMEELAGTVQAAVSAYGFDRIAWLDPSTPLT